MPQVDAGSVNGFAGRVNCGRPIHAALSTSLKSTCPANAAKT
jgi:hypothetical protein